MEKILGGRTLATALTVCLLAPIAFPATSVAQSLLWTRLYDGTRRDDGAASLTVAPDGSLYVVGFTSIDARVTKVMLQKYSAAGALHWTRAFDETWESYGARYGVAAGPDSSVYVTNVSRGQVPRLKVRNYSPEGSLLWARGYYSADLSDGTDAAVGKLGEVYVLANENSPDGDRLLLQRYSQDGVHEWTRTYAWAGLSEANSVAVGPNGRVYVSGTADSDYDTDLFLNCYSPSGSLLWTKTYNSAPVNYDRGAGVAVGPEGGIYITGVAMMHGSLTGRLLLQKYSSAGVRLWTKIYQNPAGSFSFGNDVAVGPDGTIAVIGTRIDSLRNGYLLLRKYSPSGMLLWTTNLRHAHGLGVGIGRDGSICAAGIAGTYQRDALLQKYK